MDLERNETIGVVGLGLMGCSIATCLLMAGHPVVAIAPIESDLLHAEKKDQGTPDAIASGRVDG